MRKFVILTGVLAVLAAGGLSLSVLAFMDIGQGEPDVSLKWWTVRVAYAVLVVFIACSVTLVLGVLASPR